MDEGHIKFNCKWVKDKPVTKIIISNINTWRNRLYEIGLIGEYENGIGYGNISFRMDNNCFLITGSATGGISKLNESHYAIVNDYNLAQNSLICKGPIKASSESLSHGAIYDCRPSTNAVIHVHHLKLWNELLYVFPTTSTSATYGTPEMAMEIKRLLAAHDIEKQNTIVMGGHKEGILVFGKSLDETGNKVVELLNAYK